MNSNEGPNSPNTFRVRSTVGLRAVNAIIGVRIPDLELVVNWPVP